MAKRKEEKAIMPSVKKSISDEFPESAECLSGCFRGGGFAWERREKKEAIFSEPLLENQFLIVL